MSQYEDYCCEYWSEVDGDVGSVEWCRASVNKAGSVVGCCS